MKRTLMLGLATAAVTIVAVSPANAQRWRGGDWRTVGFTTVQGHDSDTIRVRGAERFRQLRVCVFNGPIQMRDIDVRFRNGGTQDLPTRDLMRAGTCTRNIDLAGNRRNVEAVRLRYAPLQRGWVHPVVRVQVR
nr:hypothetical protein [Sphingomonas sp.]